MKKFQEVKSVLAHINRKNIDTDSIIPKQYLKAVKREGFGEILFDDWRYLESGNLGDNHSLRKKNPDFFLNNLRYKNTQILLTGENFGCGSSREHAVWALLDYGFKVLISTSFADIFYNNCFKNGLLPIVLNKIDVEKIIENISEEEVLYTVNLQKQSIFCNKFEINFEIDERRKKTLINGTDDISETLKQIKKIREYEKRKSKITPWVFK